MWLVCSAVSLLGLPEEAQPATITNYLDGNWALYRLSVNVGDTVVWLNQPSSGTSYNYVESYGGEWKSPLLSLGESFSFTFTNAGFYAYRVGVAYPDTRAGIVVANAWTGAPPAVTINTPPDGSRLPRFGIRVQASATNAEELVEIQYFANSNLIGTGTNAPYAIEWNPSYPTNQGPYVLLAKAIDRQGGAAWSRPVNVILGPDFAVWGGRLLPTGEIVLFYNSIPIRGYGPAFVFSDSPLLTNAKGLAPTLGPGIFVDESVRGGTVERRFYGFIQR